MARAITASSAAAPVLADLLRQRLGRGELAVLSACDSAAGGVSIVDEPVHLASALLLAGYRHVVGTLWPVTDRPAARVAKEFYSALARRGHETRYTAHALNEAIRTLRGRYPDQTHAWLAYVHLGP